MASIYDRAGWKMGGTRDKYIKYESVGGQFLGRTLCGLNSLVKEFSTSPLSLIWMQESYPILIHIFRSNAVGGMQMAPKNIRSNKDMFNILGISSWVFKT